MAVAPHTLGGCRPDCCAQLSRSEKGRIYVAKRQALVLNFCTVLAQNQKQTLDGGCVPPAPAAGRPPVAAGLSADLGVAAIAWSVPGTAHRVAHFPPSTETMESLPALQRTTRTKQHLLARRRLIQRSRAEQTGQVRLFLEGPKKNLRAPPGASGRRGCLPPGMMAGRS